MACGCGQCECDGMLAGLMSGPNDPVWQGDRFRLGYNIGYTSGPFNSADIAGVLEDAGLSYNTISYILTGHFNPFISVEGNSTNYWDTAIDFRSEIYNAIARAGYPIEAQSVQIDFPAGQGGSEEAAVIPSPAQSSSGSAGPSTAVPRGPSGTCDQLNLPDWLACKLGVTTSTATIIGAVVGVGAFILITRR